MSVVIYHWTSQHTFTKVNKKVTTKADFEVSYGLLTTLRTHRQTRMKGECVQELPNSKPMFWYACKRMQNIEGVSIKKCIKQRLKKYNDYKWFNYERGIMYRLTPKLSLN